MLRGAAQSFPHLRVAANRPTTDKPGSTHKNGREPEVRGRIYLSKKTCLDANRIVVIASSSNDAADDSETSEDGDDEAGTTEFRSLFGSGGLTLNSHRGSRSSYWRESHRSSRS